jgi:uncharacterized protein YukE
MQAMRIAPTPPAVARVDGSPTDAEAMATRVSRAADAVDGHHDIVSRAAIVDTVGDGSWTGLGANAYRAAISPLCDQMATAHTGLLRGAKAIRGYADELEDLQRVRRRLEDRRSELAGAVAIHAEEVRSWAGVEMPHEVLVDLCSRADELERLVEDFRADGDVLRAAAESNESTFVAALSAVAGIAASGRSLTGEGNLRPSPVRSGLDKIHRGASTSDIDAMTPTRRAQWWAGLSVGEKDAALREFPEHLGNADGLPAAVRDAANRLLLDRDVVASTAAASTANTAAARGAARRRLQKARGVRDALAAAEKAHPGVPIQLYGYDVDAFKADGKAIVSVGDLDIARDVAWNVPGMTTSIASVGGNVDAAGRLYTQATRDGGSRSMASVAWIGYDAPSGIDLGAVTASGSAEDGGNLLAADIAGFIAARDQAHLGQGVGASDRLNLGVIGHSYGSATVGWAGDGGRLAGQVDTVTLIGSPGAGGVTSAREFGIGADNVFVGAASNDLVAHLGSPTGDESFGISGLGSDPATTRFGGERFRAEGGDPELVIGSHNSYYQAGTESLTNLARIVTGHGDDISHENRRSLWDVMDGWETGRDRAVASRESDGG